MSWRSRAFSMASSSIQANSMRFTRCWRSKFSRLYSYSQRIIGRSTRRLNKRMTGPSTLRWLGKQDRVVITAFHAPAQNALDRHEQVGVAILQGPSTTEKSEPPLAAQVV